MDLVSEREREREREREKEDEIKGRETQKNINIKRGEGCSFENASLCNGALCIAIYLQILLHYYYFFVKLKANFSPMIP